MAQGVDVVVVTPVESAIAVILFGSIGFQLLIFYFLHARKRYSWRVLSQSIAIFSAVLLFQGFNGLFNAPTTYVHGVDICKAAVDMFQFVFWVTVMHLVLAITCGAINGLFRLEKPSMDQVELNVKSCTVFFSHVAAFASLNAWGSLQQMVFNSKPSYSFCVVPLAYFGLLAVSHGFAVIREHVAQTGPDEGDEYEKAWQKETQAAENNVTGISLAFLTVQAVRFTIVGTLPGQDGDDLGADSSSELLHDGAQWSKLLGCALACSGASFLLLNFDRLLARCVGDTHRFYDRLLARCVENPCDCVQRFVIVLNNYIVFVAFWSVFYGCKLAFASTGITQERSLSLVSVALCLSVVSLAFVFVLEQVERYDLFGSDSLVSGIAAEQVITALGVLIGFSWEHSFGTAVTVLAVSMDSWCPRSISTLIISCLLVTVIFPAWRIYILRTECELLEYQHDEEKSVLKQVASQHYVSIMNKDIDDNALDLAYLQMKQHRRNAHGISNNTNNRPGLKRIRVTANGIEEVDNDMELLYNSPSQGRGTSISQDNRQSLSESLLA